jgi:hypothetical protein
MDQTQTEPDIVFNNGCFVLSPPALNMILCRLSFFLQFLKHQKGTSPKVLFVNFSITIFSFVFFSPWFYYRPNGSCKKKREIEQSLLLEMKQKLLWSPLSILLLCPSVLPPLVALPFFLIHHVFIILIVVMFHPNNYSTFLGSECTFSFCN